MSKNAKLRAIPYQRYMPLSLCKFVSKHVERNLVHCISCMLNCPFNFRLKDFLHNSKMIKNIAEVIFIDF